MFLEEIKLKNEMLNFIKIKNILNLHYRYQCVEEHFVSGSLLYINNKGYINSEKKLIKLFDC